MAKTKSYIGIKNAADTSTLELHFTDYIYDGFDWETWEMTNLVQETINKIKDANPSKIKVVINSLGGDVMVGLALYNYIKNHKAEKEVEIIGFAASIASVMAMCADPGKLKMAKNAFMIIHAAWSMAVGNADEIREQAANLDKITNELADIYAQRSGKEAKHFTKLWKNGDHWMTGTEALEEGLVDELFNAEPVKAGLDFTAHNFKHIPAGLIAASVEKPAEDHKTFFSSLKTDLMAIVDSFKAAIKGGKEDKKFENVAGKNEVLDMVEQILTPVINEIDTAIKNVDPKPEPTPTPTPTPTPSPEPIPSTPTGPATGPAEDSVETIKAENKRLKAALAAKETKPEAGDADKVRAERMKGIKVSYAKDDDDVLVED
jgi:ATP-dependent Clp endopeptidase proteolytic subunit ClpP